MATIDGAMPRRRFLAQSAVISVGAAAISLAPSLARSRVGANTSATTTDVIEHVVNGSFEDGPTGSTIPGWTATRPTI